MRVSLFRTALAIFAFAACTDEVIGAIPPSRFHFRTLVPSQGDEASGWRAAQVVITLSGPFGRAACQVEVGMPFMTTKQGRISEERAQIAAAMAADEAARLVLANATPATMSAILCQNFIHEMNRLLKDEISGAHVSRFQTAGPTPSHWP